MNQQKIRTTNSFRRSSFVLLLALYPIGAFCQVPVTQVEFSSATNGIAVTHWQVFGPFRLTDQRMQPNPASNAPADPNRDFLKDYRQSETAIEAQSFSALKQPANGVPIDTRIINKSLEADHLSNILSLTSSQEDREYAVAYAGAILSSPQDQDIALAFGMDNNGRAWLNHELLFADSSPQHNRMRTFHHFVGVHLKKGDNFLLVKTGDVMAWWELSVTLFPHNQRLLELARDNAVDPILQSAVVARNESLALRGDLLPMAESLRVEIEDARHANVDKGELKFVRKMSWPLDKLEKDRLYYCRITANGQSLERPFYYGDLQAGYDRLKAQTDQATTTDELVTMDLAAPLARLQHLMVPDSRWTEWWDQKVAEMFSQAEYNLAALSAGSETFRGAAGTHLRGYRSSIDGQVQNYWIHIPENLQRTTKRIPLVIVMPWTPATNFPFLESANLAELAEDQRYRFLGDQYGFAVLQFWGRGMYQGGTAIWNQDFSEALSAVEHDYPIDTERIYLTGTCEGGRQALLLAERYPGRFAAVGVDGPITSIRRRPSFDSLWLQYVSPISQVGQLIDTPVLISHDVNDNDPPIADSESFVFRAREAGVNIWLVKRQGGDHFLSADYVATKRSFFEFFQGKARTTSPRKLPLDASLQRFGKGRGPIEDAFGGPILFVEGTQGTPDQSLAIHGNLEELKADWKETYFVDCPTKKDTEVTDEDLRTKNLILIGDAETNSIIKQVSDNAPLRNTSTGISVEGKNIDGENLGYVYISPNPLNSSKYIVQIGMNKWRNVKGWRLHLPRNGVCDYFIFDLQKPAPRLIGSGYLEQAWQQAARN